MTRDAPKSTVLRMSEDCLPLPAVFPVCRRCGGELSLVATPWPSGGTLLRWMCFDGGLADPPCSDSPLRQGPIPELVPHPISRVLVTRTQLLTWAAGIDTSVAELLRSLRAKHHKRQARLKGAAAARVIDSILDEITKHTDPAQVPVTPIEPPLEPEPEPAREPPKLEILGGPGNPVCPTCGAKGDEPCRTASGKLARTPHAGWASR